MKQDSSANHNQNLLFDEKYLAMIENDELAYQEKEVFQKIIAHFMKAEDHENAHIAINHAISQHPYSLEFYLDRTKLLIRESALSDAMEEIDTCLSFNPAYVGGRILKAEIFICMKRYQEAIDLLQNTLKYDDLHGKIYYVLGKAYKDLEEFDKALTFFKEAIINGNSDARVLFEAARCLEKMGEYESSLMYYRNYINGNPYCSSAWFNLGNVYSQIEKKQKALTAYEYALLIEDGFADATFNRAILCTELQRYEEAIENYIEAMKTEGLNTSICSYICDCYHELKKPVMADRYLLLSLYSAN